jgi:hypothetical protein
MTPSEAFVSELCNKSFLPFWSFPNPIGKKNKELCDILVVCGNLLFIISVKDISPSQHPNSEISLKRWNKKAIEDSVKQIYGAERFLETETKVLLKDYKTTIDLPSPNSRKVFRIAIAFGAPESGGVLTSDFGKGIVHVLNEKSTDSLFKELDTIIDFSTYLADKEDLLQGTRVICPSELDLLGWYLQGSFPSVNGQNYISLPEGIWRDYEKSQEYRNWRTRIEPSYVWDVMIQSFYNDHSSNSVPANLLSQTESALRNINLENRNTRAELGRLLEDMINKKELKARMLMALPNTKHTYVFMPVSEKNYNTRETELTQRCMIARVENANTPQIIGIGVGNTKERGPFFDLVHLDIEEIDEELKTLVNDIRNEKGYFKNVKPFHSDDI